MSMQNKSIITAFHAHADNLALLIPQLRERLTHALTDHHVEIHDISARLKSPESLAKKTARPDKIYQSLNDITDILGIRVITYFEDAVDQVASVIEQQFEVDFEHSIDKRSIEAPDRFGYKSLHYICKLPPGLVRQGLPEGLRFEIQIRTILQHTWAEIEHDLGYKFPKAVPDAIRRKFSRLAGLLELADEEFVAIKTELGKYQTETDKPTELDQSALNLISLKKLTQQPDLKQLDQVIANDLNLPLEKDLFFPDYLIKMLELTGLPNPASILEAMKNMDKQLSQFIKCYFAFTQKAFGFSGKDLDRIHSGYVLFFLAHLNLLQGDDLELKRLEKLSDFYHQLDYPDSKEEAQKVAILFMEYCSQCFHS